MTTQEAVDAFVQHARLDTTSPETDPVTAARARRDARAANAWRTDGVRSEEDERLAESVKDLVAKGDEAALSKVAKQLRAKADNVERQEAADGEQETSADLRRAVDGASSDALRRALETIERAIGASPVRTDGVTITAAHRRELRVRSDERNLRACFTGITDEEIDEVRTALGADEMVPADDVEAVLSAFRARVRTDAGDDIVTAARAARDERARNAWKSGGMR